MMGEVWRLSPKEARMQEGALLIPKWGRANKHAPPWRSHAVHYRPTRADMAALGC
jgi:hypothetical protein